LGIKGDRNFDLSKKRICSARLEEALRQSRKRPLFEKKERIWVNSQKGRDEGFWRRSYFERE